MDSKTQTPKKPVHFTFASAPLLIPESTCSIPKPTPAPAPTPWYKHVYFYTICSGIIGFVSGYGVAKLNTGLEKAMK